jgi:hypothetical protein
MLITFVVKFELSNRIKPVQDRIKFYFYYYLI